MNADIQSMLQQIEAIKSDGQAIVSGLTDERLNLHPAERSWSILDCLEHLNVSVTKTLPAFDRSIAEGRARGQVSNGPFRYGWFARMLAASMEPPPNWRMSASLHRLTACCGCPSVPTSTSSSPTTAGISGKPGTSETGLLDKPIPN